MALRPWTGPSRDGVNAQNRRACSWSSVLALGAGDPPAHGGGRRVADYHTRQVAPFTRVNAGCFLNNPGVTNSSPILQRDTLEA